MAGKGFTFFKRYLGKCLTYKFDPRLSSFTAFIKEFKMVLIFVESTFLYYKLISEVIRLPFGLHGSDICRVFLGAILVSFHKMEIDSASQTTDRGSMRGVQFAISDSIYGSEGGGVSYAAVQAERRLIL